MPNVPASPKGNIPTGYGGLNKGLQEGTTAYGSMLVPLNGHTAASAVALTFQAAALDGVEPLELHFRYMDATTQVAGLFATSLDGVANLSTIHRRVDASGYTILHCYDLYKQGGTLYVAPDADPGADGFMDYFIVYGNPKGS